MTNERQNYIYKMVELANDIVKNYTWEKWQMLWKMSVDWNSSHNEKEVIEMCEHEDDEGEVDGFYIEDDYWIIPE